MGGRERIPGEESVARIGRRRQNLVRRRREGTRRQRVAVGRALSDEDAGVRSRNRTKPSLAAGR